MDSIDAERKLPTGHVRAMPFPRSVYTRAVDAAIAAIGGPRPLTKLPGTLGNSGRPLPCGKCTYLLPCLFHKHARKFSRDKGK